MLEIRYNKTTKEITGWWGSRFGNHEIKLANRPDEAIVELDIPIPDKPSDAWLYDEATQTLIPNPDYIEPYDPSLDIATLQELLSTSPSVITMPDIWESLRIYARLLGYTT